MLDNIVISICRTIQDKVDIMPKPWQVSIIIDMIHKKKKVVILAGIRSGKSLPYQLISFIREKAIVFVILLTIMLMTDQVYFPIITFLMQVIDANYCSVNHYQNKRLVL